jgi:hypothetical protein
VAGGVLLAGVGLHLDEGDGDAGVRDLRAEQRGRDVVDGGKQVQPAGGVDRGA